MTFPASVHEGAGVRASVVRRPGPDRAGKDQLRHGCQPLRYSRETWLLGLSSRKVGNLGIGNTRELTADRILHEIKDRKAPVVISWEYLDPASLSAADRLQRAGIG